MPSPGAVFSALLLLNFLSKVTPSNPDSEIFQDASDGDQGDQRNTLKLVSQGNPSTFNSTEMQRLSRSDQNYKFVVRVYSTVKHTRGFQSRERVWTSWHPYIPAEPYGGSSERLRPKDNKDEFGNPNYPYPGSFYRPEQSTSREEGAINKSHNPTSSTKNPSSILFPKAPPNVDLYGNSKGGPTSYGTRSSRPNAEGHKDGYVPRVQPTFQYQRASSSLYPLQEVRPTPRAPRPAIGYDRYPANPVKGSDNGHRPESIPDDPDSNLFSGIINDFSFTLMSRMNLETNFVVSPLSIFIALSMCYLGSAGATKSQLEDALGLNERNIRETKLHEGIRNLETMIVSRASEYQLFLANGMFLAKNLSVSSQFKSNIQNYYAAVLKNVDFDKPELSVPDINDWVSTNTGNKIRSFFDQPPNPRTQVLLLNAIYFKGIWKTQFPLQFTYDSTFFPAPGLSKRIPTMVLYNESFPYYRSEKHQHSFLTLPYQGDRISMIIALPHVFYQNPMPKLTDADLCSIRNEMKETRLDTIAVPKYRFEHTTLLKEALQRLGIVDLFDAGTADLSNMRPEKDLVVSSVVHKVLMEVNEQGTTASAVTGVKIVPLTLRNTTDFIVNHPFAFYIVHEESGLVLFHGKVYDIHGETVDVAPNSPREDALPEQRSRPRPPQYSGQN